LGYARPSDLGQALALMAERRWTVLAGGTDLYPATTAQTLAGDVLDINGIAPLRGISRTEGGWRIGARTTWTDVIEAELPAAFRGLQQAAREVGSVQIQNSGTIAGNLCNASPAADGVPALLVLDAEAELSSARGTRQLALEEFLTGPRQTQRTEDEILTAILIPERATSGTSGFLKLGARKYLVISIAMVAVRLVARDGAVAEAALSIGSCSAVAQRLPQVESALVGGVLNDLGERIKANDVAGALRPIDDIRGTADYRSKAAVELLRRAVSQTAAGLA
jgi:CO/xanthine dehydrogenase FAD-binding subunit